MDSMNFKENLIQLLKKPLPGEEAQWRMAHIAREKLNEKELDGRKARQSAVMVLFCKNEANDYFLPLTLRWDYKGVHSNQVSFPGGKMEESDESLMHTAIRECEEEIGVKNDVDILGRLTPLYIPVSNFMVHPFVGYSNTLNPVFTPQQSEVKQVLKLHTHDLLSNSIEKETIVNPAPNIRFKTPYFDVEGQVVWGATAMILSELKAVLKA
jgi:8-oxo-dGTP pyrophosphatase MutT (NUDIX family)